MKKMTSTLTKRMVLAGMSIVVLAFACKSREDAIEPRTSQHNATEATLRLSIGRPNEVVLRGEGQAKKDPLTMIKRLRFVFYRQGSKGYQVAVIKEQNIEEDSQLENLKLVLPQDDYKLVVVANPSARLIELTAPDMPLDSVVQARPMKSSQFRVARDVYEGVSMLNEQGALSIPSGAFSEGHLPTRVTLEASLARVLVYGNPQLNGGRKGNAPARYVVSNLLNEVAPLRPLGKLLSGQDELVGDQSLKSNRYAASSVWAQWQESKPQNTRGVGHFTPELYAMDELWTSVAMTPEAYKSRLGEGNLYVKESVIPPTAYLRGTVPCVVLAYPYIPRGVTLTDGEGWVAFRGVYYSEKSFKSFITSQQYPTDALKEAVNKASIGLDAFNQSFDKEGIRFYHQGISYYTIYIKHFGHSESPKAHGLYGVVRGNEYRVKLVSISEPGLPVPPVFTDNLDEISESSFTGISTGTTAVVERDQSAQL